MKMMLGKILFCICSNALLSQISGAQTPPPETHASPTELRTSALNQLRTLFMLPPDTTETEVAARIIRLSENKPLNSKEKIEDDVFRILANNPNSTLSDFRTIDLRRARSITKRKIAALRQLESVLAKPETDAGQNSPLRLAVENVLKNTSSGKRNAVVTEQLTKLANNLGHSRPTQDKMKLLEEYPEQRHSVLPLNYKNKFMPSHNKGWRKEGPMPSREEPAPRD